MLLFIIFQFTLTAGFNTAGAGAAGGGEGGGGEEEGTTSSVLILPLPDNNVLDPKEASFFLKR